MAIRLNHRERWALGLMGLCIGLFVLAQFAVFPLLDERERLQRAVRAKSQVLADLSELRARHAQLLGQAASAKERFGRRAPGFTLFAFLEQLAGRAGIKEKIATMKPSTLPASADRAGAAQVEMAIRGVTLNRLVPYLHLIETSENVVYVRKLSIARAEKPEQTVNALLLVEAPR